MGTETSGIVVVDKPARISSAKVVAVVKRVFGARKAGHTGTLDPFATGVLVCCLNRATRLARFFLHDDKTYQARLCLGAETDTQDATGKVTASVKELTLSEAAIRAAFKKFEGTISQVPPVYSALKHKGTPLYKLARRGTPVQKEARQVVISRLHINAIRLPEIDFKVTCSGGTYIRTLCTDIGRTLGCGGHLKTLRRIESSGFTIEEAITLEAIESLAGSDRLATIPISMAYSLRHIPGVAADDALVEKIRYGRKITAEDMKGPLSPNQGSGSEKGPLKVLDSDRQLLAVIDYNRQTGDYDYCVNLQ